jgi:hypothetical protein
MATIPGKAAQSGAVQFVPQRAGQATALSVQTSRFIPAAALAKNAIMPAHLPLIAPAIRIIGPVFRAA